MFLSRHQHRKSQKGRNAISHRDSERRILEIAEWILALATTVLAAATIFLAYFTYSLGMFTKQMNQLEAQRDEQIRAEKKRIELSKAIELGRQIAGLDSSVFAAKVIAKRPTNAVGFCSPIEKILAYRQVFTPSNRQMLLRLINEILRHAETSWQGIDIAISREALQKEMQQLIDIVSKEIVAWRSEFSSS